MTITIHAIFNAHLDPVWLWPWTAGLDEVLATSRSACDRLDAHPDLFYTSGEAWPLAMIERCDQRLWQRVVQFIHSGRWEIINGWWSQPDCNFPTATGLRRHIAAGHDWLRQRFPTLPLRTGFNPDSFGHCAAMPEILRTSGQDSYVFMRPQPHELHLPAQLFTWRSRPDGPGVTAFRIARTYANGCFGLDIEALREATLGLPPGCSHTMAFFGVGDHGGGPTEALVRWVAENPDIIPGARLTFSTIGRFFAAVAAEAAPLPEVIGELQQHAIGCYSVHRASKVALRRAEQQLERAEHVATADDHAALAAGWRTIALHQAHDTAGGTCIPAAYDSVLDQLGGVTAASEEILVFALRRQLNQLPDEPLPRLILANPGGNHVDGWCEAAVYVEGIWKDPWRLLDSAGLDVPFQLIHPGLGLPEGGPWALRRILVRKTIPAGQLEVLRLDLSTPAQAIATQVHAAADGLRNDAGMHLRLDQSAAHLSLHAEVARRITLHLIPDGSDTWSHDLDRYGDQDCQEPSWEPPVVLDQGPLMVAVSQAGRIGESRLQAEWRMHAGECAVDVLLEVQWAEKHQLLKLVVPLAGESERCDATPGMGLIRPNDGREMPLHGWLHTSSMSVVCPDMYAVDATSTRARFTLLRSPVLAHHEPHRANFPRAEIADQGRHRFRFRFHLRPVTQAQLSAEATSWALPPLVAELTRGMPARFTAYRTPSEIAR